jgi:hypothetical protein
MPTPRLSSRMPHSSGRPPTSSTSLRPRRMKRTLPSACSGPSPRILQSVRFQGARVIEIGNRCSSAGIAIASRTGRWTARGTRVASLNTTGFNSTTAGRGGEGGVCAAIRAEREMARAAARRLRLHTEYDCLVERASMRAWTLSDAAALQGAVTITTPGSCGPPRARTRPRGTGTTRRDRPRPTARKPPVR